ncbi:MAG: MTH1187 family thiamine-binding protein [Armatimonadota bacterium]|nr:MTH1187 family thiamine-binding protein [bacterium]
MVVAEFSITPLGKSEIKPFIDAAVREVEKSGLKYEVDAMATTIEGELDEILNVVRNAHAAVKASGAERILLELRIDDRAYGITIDEEIADYRASV